MHIHTTLKDTCVAIIYPSFYTQFGYILSVVRFQLRPLPLLVSSQHEPLLMFGDIYIPFDL